MDSDSWKRWVDLEQIGEPTALVYGPLEYVGNYHPTVLGLVSDKRCTNSASPGIDVREDVQDGDATVTCSVTFGPCVPLLPSGRNSKVAYPLNTSATAQDFLMRVMYAVCDVICIRSSKLEVAVDQFLMWLDSCISVIRNPNRPSIILSIDEMHLIGPRVLTQFEMICTQRIEDSGSAKTSTIAVRDSMRRCFSDIVIVPTGADPEDHTNKRPMLKVALQDRIKTECFYSVKTVVRLLEKSCEHFATGLNDAFCFISCLRREVLPEIPSTDDSQLTAYFRACNDVSALTSFAFPAIGQGLARDSLRISCHREFDRTKTSQRLTMFDRFCGLPLVPCTVCGFVLSCSSTGK